MSDTSVVTDFTSRRSRQVSLARLVALLGRREAEVLADPIKHLGDAGKKIAEQAQFIESLRDALYEATAVKFSSATMPARPVSNEIMVRRSEWEALQRIAARLRAYV